MDLAQLQALHATVEEGTLDAAARRLHLTPSAVSQRLKALENATGRVLLVRSKPVRVTEAGEAVLRVARQIETLLDELKPENDDATLAIAVNADSLATWVLPALAPLAKDIRFRFHREDQDFTTDLLREGTVTAAVTTETTPVPGCTATPLGRMRYRPTASRDFANRWFPDGVTPEALRHAPAVSFDSRDALQRDYQRRISGDPLPPHHLVPASADFVQAVRLGMGWAMLPDLQIEDDLRTNDLVDLDPAGAVDVPLTWQQWKLRSPALDRTSEAIRRAAADSLRQTGRAPAESGRGSSQN